mmetsp:Transcript_26942/g.27173  ORF Transcript_26942/g.27173 Transcript_26942/m.27173 type:complete len:605 (+) Transcript_26942:52-1866(+)
MDTLYHTRIIHSYYLLLIFSAYIKVINGSDDININRDASSYCSCQENLDFNQLEIKLPPPFLSVNYYTSIDSPLGISINSTGGLSSKDGTTVNLNRWRNQLCAINSQQEITIVFIGGSMTSGRMPGQMQDGSETSHNCSRHEACNNGQGFPDLNSDCRPCAYPAFFHTLLQSLYPHKQVNVINLAVGGTSSRAILSIVGDQLKALPVINFLYFHFTTNDHGEDAKFVGAGFEQLMRYLLKIPSAPAITGINMLGNMPVHMNITQYYGIPMLQPEQYVLPRKDIREKDNNNDYVGFFPKLIHPAWPYHKLIGNFLIAAWKVQYDRLCDENYILKTSYDPLSASPPSVSVSVSSSSEEKKKHLFNSMHSKYTLPPPTFKDQLTMFDTFCVHPTESIHADNLEQYVFYRDSGTNSSSSNWKLGEDMVGNNKPGWWIDDVSGGNITFRLHMLFPHPVIGLGYLRSYENMGRVRIHVDDQEDETVMINALDSSRRVSVTAYQRLCTSNETDAEDMTASPPSESPDTLTLSASSPESESEAENDVQKWTGNFPACSMSASHDRYRHHINQGFGGNFKGHRQPHDLHIELLPSTDKSATHNKFKIMYIVTC